MPRLILAVITLVHILAGLRKASANFDLWQHVHNFRPTQDLLQEGPIRQVRDLPVLTFNDLPSQGQILLSTEIDGVLKPLNDATPDHQSPAVPLLQTLSQKRSVVTLVNSARSLPALNSYRGIGAHLAAEHGTILLPAGEAWVKEFFVERTGDIRYQIQQIAARYSGAGIKFQDPKNTIAFTHAKTPQALRQMEQVYTEIEGLLEGTEFGLIKRTGSSEVAYFDVDKGNLVVKLLQSGQFHGGIALGNTEADDGAFMAMNQMENPKFISVIVSNNLEQKTDAKYRLSSVADVHNILRGLAR
ncbi:hypothetical protein PCANC_09851 [Puccinia coronata f. sp. avenae]|uniref:Trehalose 6-phosphate phosphatase n=1 Tax=Puccinia coronata f. sp. avenae TaxID=200324 RepID=A0A2N5T415_9BASI|nr:hypothetical protein PCANC_09851 [Puccinia coronata f. sp. avenae]